MSITSESFELYKKNLRLMVPILIAIIVIGIVQFVYALSVLPIFFKRIRPSIISPFAIYIILSLTVIALSPIMVFGGILLTIMEGVTVIMCREILEGRSITFGEAVKKTKNFLFQLTIVGFLVEVLTILVSLIPIVGFFIDSFLRTIFSAAPVLIILSKVKALNSLRLSYSLVKSLWNNEGIAVIIIFVIFFVAKLVKGIIRLVILILGLPYITTLLTYYCLKHVYTMK